MNRFEEDPPDDLADSSLLRWVRQAVKQQRISFNPLILY